MKMNHEQQIIKVKQELETKQIELEKLEAEQAILDAESPEKKLSRVIHDTWRHNECDWAYGDRSNTHCQTTSLNVALDFIKYLRQDCAEVEFSFDERLPMVVALAYLKARGTRF